MSGTEGDIAPVGRRIAPEQLIEFVKRCYKAAGLSDEDASIVARLLVETELHGVVTHGVIRVPSYIARLQQGGLNPRPNFRCVTDSPSSAILSADNAPGHLAGKRGVDIAIEKAGATGVGAVAVTQSDHFGACGTYAALCAQNDMIGMVWSNSFPIMSAWGGYGNHITNAPFACAFPAGARPTVLLDVCMSSISTGAVRIAAELSEKLPGKLILDANGNPTDDPQALLNGGSHMSIGEHKGYALAIVAELLSGVLAGGPFLQSIPLWDKDPSRPSGTGHFVLAISIRHFIDVQIFKGLADRLVDELTSHPARPGFDKIRVPGEAAAQRSADYRANGIPISFQTLKNLQELGEELGFGPNAI